MDFKKEIPEFFVAVVPGEFKQTVIQLPATKEKVGLSY
jgi:hypothetical protein